MLSTRVSIPIGTRLRVVAAGSHTLNFVPVDSPERTLLLRFDFGAKRWSAADYFHAILRDEDPRPAIRDAAPDVADAIARGRLLVGMTKAQTLMARGYPPMHHTDGIDADAWLYYEAPSLVSHVTFRDGRIQTMEPGAAP